MDIKQAQDRFIQIWGTVGVEWGISRTMAQVHALLMSSSEALSTDEIMESLNISRGNANMNLRELVNWGLVYREVKSGDRKDYFIGEKNIWEVAQKIASERRKRELEPMMKMLEQLIEDTKKVKTESDNHQNFSKLLEDIHDLGKKSRYVIDLVLKLDKITFFNPLKSLVKGKNVI